MVLKLQPELLQQLHGATAARRLEFWLMRPAAVWAILPALERCTQLRELYSHNSYYDDNEPDMLRELYSHNCYYDDNEPDMLPAMLRCTLCSLCAGMYVSSVVCC